MDFQQSRTFINLQSAFEGELISSSKYEIYGIRAREEDYQQIGYTFDVISHYQREHARIWWRLLNNGVLPNTLTNLLEAADAEDVRGNSIYRDYADIAREEGYDSIASLFDGVANIELNSEVIFRTFADEIQTNQVFCKNEEVLWVCINCGNILGGLCAPAICPICGFPQGYYQVYDTGY
ncbi:rubrerythrin family protein [Anaerocolumna sp. AGMB13025]|uniref:rubrerythrin family protein n=1 Tax=Anaerocolumna sp. AGMB13025 TaxID=3039116 RepID=UPI00241EB969|nr:rubrerythrin family protein [Anaerocolumna sp. AGMB13025]WFR56191.1 rubrerythrin family protein [Anaerocolumna sp. AGMB13025]